MPSAHATPEAPATADYHDANEVKVSFDDVYAAPTPHGYLAAMGSTGYCIAEQARPYFVSAVELLREVNGEAWPVQLVDLGCSYGVGSATVNSRCSFDEFRSFFASRAPRDYHACVEATRRWIQAVPAPEELRIVGVDTSAAAIQFATDAGLLAGGVTRNLEEEDPTPDECAWFAGCNLLTSTGAIGYVTDRTVRRILECLGRDHPGEFGPLAVMTVLRMFDVGPVQQAFEARDLRFTRVPKVRLQQRRFKDADERRGVLRVLEDGGVDTEGWESTGWLYADLFVAAPPARIDSVLARLQQVAHPPRRAFARLLHRAQG